MLINLSLKQSITLKPSLRTIYLAGSFMASFAISGGFAIAQESAPAPEATVSTVAPTIQKASSSPAWMELTSMQQQALQPLEATWGTLATGHKRKWISISQNFQALGPKEQEKLHARMREWAALKPSERTLARLNFAETKKIAQSDRSSHWEAYQALSPEEKAELAAQAAKLKASAALALKPVPAEKLAPVPVTRKTPILADELAILKQSINRNTLLPITKPNAQVAKQP